MLPSNKPLSASLIPRFVSGYVSARATIVPSPSCTRKPTVPSLSFQKAFAGHLGQRSPQRRLGRTGGCRRPQVTNPRTDRLAGVQFRAEVGTFRFCGRRSVSAPVRRPVVDMEPLLEARASLPAAFATVPTPARLAVCCESSQARPPGHHHQRMSLPHPVLQFSHLVVLQTDERFEDQEAADPLQRLARDGAAQPATGYSRRSSTKYAALVP